MYIQWVFSPKLLCKPIELLNKATFKLNCPIFSGTVSKNRKQVYFTELSPLRMHFTISSRFIESHLSEVFDINLTVPPKFFINYGILSHSQIEYIQYTQHLVHMHVCMYETTLLHPHFMQIILPPSCHSSPQIDPSSESTPV